MTPAVFLDLQGTLGGEGLADIRTFAFFPCADAAIRLLNTHGLRAIVVTNQSNIAKGLFTHAEYEQHAARLTQELAKQGALLDAIYCCPHRASDVCECQKPKPGMLHAAQRDFDLDLAASYVVGDWGSMDMALARAAGCKAIFVRTGVGEDSLTIYRHTWANITPDYIADDVLQAATWIVQDRTEETPL